MSRYRFELACERDDAELRGVLADTPMPGHVELSFRREPSFFAAAVVDGDFRQVVAAREVQSQRIVGFGSRSIGPKFVNGRVESIGYLSSLRLRAEHRRQGLVARGYAFFRKLHADGRTRLYLTTIAAGNEAAITQLTSARAGLPAYHAAGRYHTLAIPLTNKPVQDRAAGVNIRTATQSDVPEVLDFLAEHGSRRQFFPAYRAADFFSDDGALRGLAPGDLWLAFRRGRLAGLLGRWNQQSFRQTVVHGYHGPLGWLRPVYNAWSIVRRLPRLPRPGQSLAFLTAALPLVAGDDPQVFTALLRSACAARPTQRAGFLLLGLHESDPLLAAARAWATASYTTLVYLVCFEDGDELRRSLDGRPLYLELGSL